MTTQSTEVPSVIVREQTSRTQKRKYTIEYPEGCPLNVTSTHEEDMPLFKRLGLITFANLPAHEQLYLGTVFVPESKCEIKVRVHVLPAQYYSFQLWFHGENGFNQCIIELSTDTGCFRYYWPLVEKIAKRELAVVETKRYKAYRVLTQDVYVHARKVMRWNTTAA